MPRWSARELAASLRLPPPTAEQAAVIEAPLQAGVVVAGAGSGKTETMAARVVWLVANGLVRPDQVLGLTFTRKAARELGGRIRRRLVQLAARGLTSGPHGATHGAAQAADEGGEVTVLTYDAYAQRIVTEHALRLGREPGARLVPPAVAWQYAARVVGAYDGPMDDVELAYSTVVDAVLALHGHCCGHLVAADRLVGFTERLRETILGKPANGRTGPYRDVAVMLARQQARLALLPLVAAFEQELRRREAIDFAEQAALAARLARDFPQVGERERARYAVVLLDEYQDTSHAQLVLMRGLFGADHPVVAVGDPCQAIYGWRGASAAALAAFGRDFGGASGASVRSLRTSFRNGAAILRVANVLAEPLRREGLDVPVLDAHPATGAGEVVAALHPTVAAETSDVADRVAALWRADAAARAAGEQARSVAVLVRRRSQIDPLATALRARGLPVEVVGVGGLLATAAVGDVVATLRVLDDPRRGDALMRLLTGARWRIGPRDLRALGRWARHRASEPRQPAAGGAGSSLATPSPAGPDRAPASGGDAADTRGAAPEATPGPAPRPGGDQTADEVDEHSIVEALDALPGPGWFSPEGGRRLAALGAELRALRRSVSQPLPELVGEVIRTLGLDVEVAARAGDPAVARADLDAFCDVAATFAESGEGDTLTAFLAYLDAAEAEERGLEPGEVDVSGDRVQLLTVHGAKGLEWDAVFVPGLVEGVFPAAGERDRAWLTDVAELPFPLRGDAAALPVLDLAAAADQRAVRDAVDSFVAACGDWARREERRLAYVAVTRARQLAVCSGYRWDDTRKPRRPSAYLCEIAQACRAGAGTVAVWAPEPAPEEVNPLTVEAPHHPWPYDPLPAGRRAELDRGARLVAAAAVGFQQHGGPGGAAVDPDAARWRRDVDLLLAERAGRTPAAEVAVELPAQLSVSQLVLLRKDPAALARSIRRPQPVPPSPQSRRGTAFHAWLERRYGQPQLLEIDELPGAADAEPALDEDLADLQEAFLATEWADRRPIHVEAPFELPLGGVVLRGRADAVFPLELPDGAPGLEVVDWKTGRQPTDPAESAARAVQLAAYRLAWSHLASLPLGHVRAAFCYVRDRVTVRPVDLLDRSGLEALLASVDPIAGPEDG